MVIAATLRGQTPTSLPDRTITEADCSAAKLGDSIPTTAIGEPVAGITLSAPRWVAAAAVPAYCAIDGAMLPMDKSAYGRNINFRVVLPAVWTHHAAQIGGGGFNGTIPNLTGQEAAVLVRQGFVTYGSDSGHQQGAGVSPEWTLSDEAIKNLGYMQMKKTHDAAMTIIQRMYSERPKFNYYIGTSQGGREALTVAQRYAKDYNGIIANVPIVSFSSLMMGPEWIRIQEKPLANYVTTFKVEAIRNEFMRQCDGLDGLVDGIVNNYVACRAIFDVKEGSSGRHPWASKRCPGNVDPNPSDGSAAACLTDGQISTLEFVYTRYAFAAPLANGVRTFGMWLPNTEPSGSGLISDVRFNGQEGAASDALMHVHLGVLGVTGFLMRNQIANPLDYVEGGPLAPRRLQLSQWLDSTNPDLNRFANRSGKMIVTIGTNDTLASPGAQLDYYQALIDKIGQDKLRKFARLYVLPQTGHGLSGRNLGVDGEGKKIEVRPIPNSVDRIRLLMDWVERKTAPDNVVVTAGEQSLPHCEYPAFPRYFSGPPTIASSYKCVVR